MGSFFEIGGQGVVQMPARIAMFWNICEVGFALVQTAWDKTGTSVPDVVAKTVYIQACSILCDAPFFQSRRTAMLRCVER